MNYKNEPTVIFDIDGTLADIEHRRHHVSGKKKDFNSFNKEMGNDVANEPIVKLLQMCCDSGYLIIYCTGRMERDRDVTINFLNQLSITDNFVPEHLMMRANKRRSDPDWEVKQDMLHEILKTLDKENILFTVDDRQKVVDMWRANGLTCLQVAEGNF